jgi:hypothetical protein
MEGGGKKTMVKCRQLPLAAGTPYTDHRAQGQMLKYAIIDIGKTPSFPLSPFNTYMALSQSRGWDNIRLLREFDDSLFTHHLSDNLRREDERLEMLDRNTKEWWEERKGG